jgi:cytochrome c peroxidase
MGFAYENNGVQPTMVDNGLGDVTGLSTDIGKFKPPTLRNIEFTAPYMHAGQFNTLEEVVEFYNSGVNQSSPNISPLMLKSNRPGGSLNLSVEERADLVAFLKTLSDPDFVNNPDFMDPN